MATIAKTYRWDMTYDEAVAFLAREAGLPESVKTVDDARILMSRIDNGEVEGTDPYLSDLFGTLGRFCNLIRVLSEETPAYRGAAAARLKEGE